MRWRCGLFCLAFLALFGVNLVSEELFGTEEGPRHPSGTFSSLRQRPNAELFKGRYELRTNGTNGAPVVFSGSARLTVGWQRTSILAVQVLSAAISLVGAEDHLVDVERALGFSRQGASLDSDSSGGSAGGRDVDLVLRAVEFMAAGEAAATGYAQSSALLAALRFRHQWPAGPAAIATAHADRAAVEAASAKDEGSAAVALEFFGGRPPNGCRLEAALRPLPAVAAAAEGGVDGGAREVLAAVGGGQEQNRDFSNAFARAERLQADVLSPDCGFSLNLAMDVIDVENFNRKATFYSVWTLALTMIQIRCYLSQMHYTDDGGPSAARLSMTCIAVQALLDAYDSFLHLSLGASSQYRTSCFAVVSMFKFILFSLFEVRYLLQIWRCRHRDVFALGWEEVRRGLSKVYSYFYGTLIGGMLVIFNAWEHLGFFALLFQAHWVPQILYDVRQGSKASVQLRFVAGISVTRSLAMLYLWGCPSGIFSGDVFPALPGSPSPRLCLAAVLLQAAQVAVMVSQQVLGPRWFIPRLCLPHVYNYRRAEVEAAAFGSDDCVICMGELGGGDGEGGAAVPAQHEPVITPCDHRFHRICLERWMDIKMECPTCRTELPPMC